MRMITYICKGEGEEAEMSNLVTNVKYERKYKYMFKPVAFLKILISVFTVIVVNSFCYYLIELSGS